MAGRREETKTQEAVSETEAKLVALAEQLGTFLGTVRGKADGWLESEALRTEVTRVRERATELLEQVNRGSKPAQQAVVSAAASARQKLGRTAAIVSASARRVVSRGTASAKKAAKRPTKKAAARTAAKVATPTASRGLVDAPGKKHRKPPPQVHIGRGMGEPEGKKMGQKSVKGDMRRGRQ